jgi:hypothetical protein
MVKADYYILLGGSETGPWTLNEVQAFWQAGAVTLETLYAQPGMSEWKPISAILDVAPPTAATSPSQSEISSGVPAANAPVGKPVEPEDMDLTKLRQWLRSKLATIGFAPKTEGTTANEHKLDDWLCRFTGSEQKVIFGPNNIHRYRKGDLTWQGLIKELERLAVPTATAEKPQGDVKQLMPENALWIMEAVCSAEPRLELDVEKYQRMAEEGVKRANEITMQRRRSLALGITEEPHA